MPKLRNLCRLLVGGTCFLLFPHSATAEHSMYVPDHTWSKQSWQCKGRNLSLIEIESTRAPTALQAVLKVSALNLDGLHIRADSVDGLEAFIASLDEVQTISSRCGSGGELVVVHGFVHGRTNPKEVQRREFFIKYARQVR